MVSRVEDLIQLIRAGKDALPRELANDWAAFASDALPQLDRAWEEQTLIAELVRLLRAHHLCYFIDADDRMHRAGDYAPSDVDGDSRPAPSAQNRMLSPWDVLFKEIVEVLRSQPAQSADERKTKKHVTLRRHERGR